MYLLLFFFCLTLPSHSDADKYYIKCLAKQLRRKKRQTVFIICKSGVGNMRRVTGGNDRKSHGRFKACFEKDSIEIQIKIQPNCLKSSHTNTDLLSVSKALLSAKIKCNATFCSIDMNNVYSNNMQRFRYL